MPWQPVRAQWTTSQPRLLQPLLYRLCSEVLMPTVLPLLPPLAMLGLFHTHSPCTLPSLLLDSARAAVSGHYSITPHLVPAMSWAL